MFFIKKKLIRFLLSLFIGNLYFSPTYVYSFEKKAASEQKISVVSEILSNGMHVVIVVNKLAPVVETMMSYDVGSVNSPKGFPGTAHALEHMMFNGSEHISRDQLAVLSARLGNKDNAFTTSDSTQYYFKASASDLDILLRIEADRMNNLTLTKTDWTHERGAIEQEVSRDLSNPIYRYYSQVRSLLYKDTAYEYDALGTRPSFDKTTIEMLRSFYQNWYVPNNATLMIIGDIDPQQTLTKVHTIFDHFSKKTIPQRAVIKLGKVKAQDLKLTTDLPIGLVTQAWRMPGARSPEFAAALLLADVIASQRAALFALVPEGKAVETGFSFQPEALGGIGLLYAGFPKGSNADDLKKKLTYIMDNYRNNGLPSELIEAARRKEIAALEFNNNSLSGLSSSWYEALINEHLSSPDDMIKAFQHVTKDQIDNLMRKYLSKDTQITAILTPGDHNGPLAEKGYGGAESFNATPMVDVKLPDWAEKTLSHIELPPPIEKPVRYTLKNGLHLIVQPEHISHTIEIFGDIRENPALEQPKGKEGVSALTNDLFLFGSQKNDRLKLAQYLDDISAEENAGSSFGVSVLTKYFPQAISLLAEHELTPSFPEEGFIILRNQAIKTQNGILTSPSYKFDYAIKKALVPISDPTLRQTTSKTLSNISLNDIKAYYKKAYRPDLTTIIIIGDISPEVAKQEIEKYFGNWHAEGTAPKTILDPIIQNKSSTKIIADPGRSQSKVHLVETLALNIYNPDIYALRLGNKMLGEGFSSFLMQDLRVKSGYVYGAGSDVSFGRTRSTLSMGFGADPDKVLSAQKLAIKDLEKLCLTPVSKNEIDLAKSTFLKSQPMLRDSFSGLASLWMSLSEMDLPFDRPDREAEIIYHMTPQDVQKAFQKWVRVKDLARIILGPAPVPMKNIKN